MTIWAVRLMRNFLQEKLDISKLEDDTFRFLGTEVHKEGDTIIISMEEYAGSLEILEIRKGKSDG